MSLSELSVLIDEHRRLMSPLSLSEVPPRLLRGPHINAWNISVLELLFPIGHIL